MILSPMLKQGQYLQGYNNTDRGWQVAMETNSSDEPDLFYNQLSSSSSSPEERQELEKQSVACPHNIQTESSSFDPSLFPFQDISSPEITEMQPSFENLLDLHTSTDNSLKRLETARNADFLCKIEESSSLNKKEKKDLPEDDDGDEDLGFHLFDDHEFESKSSNLQLYNMSHDNYMTQANTCTSSKPKVECDNVNTKDKQPVLEAIQQDVNTQVEMLGRTGTRAPQPDTTETVEEDFCCICRCTHTDPVVLSKCSHKYCRDCIDAYFHIKPVCPECFVPYGIITGNQPEGNMEHSVNSRVSLQGQDKPGAIVINYSFNNGTQTKEHPKPGKPYYGTSRTAYLPDVPEGHKVLRLLQEAFKRRLLFTVGMSRTTGADDVVTWNDIHHKTCTCGGFENFGYPDSTYLQRVQEELAAVGVTEESLEANQDSVAKQPYKIS